MFSICLRAFLPCRGGCSAFCYSPTRPPSCSKRFLKWLCVRGTPIMMCFKKKSSCCLAKFCASECNGVFQVILEIQCEALEAMLIKNDLSEVRAYKVKHVAGHVHVGGFLPSCVCFQLDSARGIGSRLLHLSPSGFAQRLTEALIIAPWGHCCSGNSWGKGDGLVDVRLSVCVSVCQSPPPFRRCIYCIHAAGMFTSSAFPVSRGKQLDGPPWHRFTSSQAAASALSCPQVTRCLSAFCYKWI